FAAARRYYLHTGRRKLEHRDAAARICRVSRRGLCGSCPTAVRFARGRARAYRRIPHRICLDEAAVVPDRRISAHGHGGVLDRDLVFWRLALAIDADGVV